MGLNFKFAWGIELGNAAVSAVKVQTVKGNHKIVAQFNIPYDSLVEKDEDFHDAAQQGLSRLIAEAGIKKSDPIITAVPGRSVFARPVTLPPMDTKRIPELIKYEASQQIPFPIEEVVWDYHVDFPEMDGEEIAATIFAVRREEIDELLAIFTEVGLKVEGIQTTPLALLNFVRYDIAPENPCILLDVKPFNIDFIILNGHSFWQRNITRGGNDINKVLMNKFKISYAQAEDLKHSVDKNRQAAKILQVMQPTFKNMSNEIQRSIGHYKSQNEGVQLTQMFCLGNALQVTRLVEHFKEALKLNMVRVDKLTKLSKQCPNPEMVNEELPSLTVPIGLALQGVGASFVSVNLLPPDIAAARIQAKKVPWLVAASLIFLISGWVYFSTVSNANAIIDEIASKPKKKLNSLEKQVNAIEKSRNLIQPKKDELYAWRTLLRDSDTLFSRDAHVVAFDQLHQALHKETTNEGDRIFIEKIEITKAIPTNSEIIISKVKAIPELNSLGDAVSQTFKVSLTGTFFQQEGGRSKNIDYVEERVIESLNSNDAFFSDWKRVQLGEFKNKDDHNIRMQRFMAEGYFSPKGSLGEEAEKEGERNE